MPLGLNCITFPEQIIIYSIHILFRFSYIIVSVNNIIKNLLIAKINI